MSRPTTKTAAGLLAGTAAAALAASMIAGPAEAAPRTSGPRAVGLTASGALLTFDVTAPGRPHRIGPVTGLGGERLVGVDYRVQDGRLYGVGSEGGVFTLSLRSGRATEVSRLTVALEGSSFGVDFNPAADRLRVVSDTGQNLRHDVNPGGATLVDTGLTYPPATTPATGVVAAAYTNNDLDADTATSLFDLETTLDQVVLQAPANSGTLSATGKLGVDAGSDAGFDIRTDVRGGTAADNRGYASLQVDGRYRLFTVSLLTGDADRIGSFPRGVRVVDLAVGLDR